MTPRILVPWAMPEIGIDVLRRAKVEIVMMHGPDGKVPTLSELIEGIRLADVLMPRGTQPIQRRAMMANPDLRGIANYGAGYDNIDTIAATELGIPVTNTPDVLTETTADLAWALLMAVARNIPQAHHYTVTGQWKKPRYEEFMGLDVGPGGSRRRKVLGIVGFGRIGRAVMERSRGFKMKVIAFDPYRKEAIEKTRGVDYRELDDLLRESDFVTLHCPLTQETRHLIGMSELDLMKPTALLINTSRGPVVDEGALVLALERGKIAGAGLDVYEREPHVTVGLLKQHNVVLLPHLGSSTKDTRGQMAVRAARNALTMVKGKRPVDIVNPEVFDSPKYLRKIGKRSGGYS